MQDKETVDDAEEALTCKTETVSDRHPDKKATPPEGKRESTKDGKFAFRKMKTPKKEKPDKNSPSRYEGEGVVFKAKLIGLESVPDARGDKMCQDAMQRLKGNVKNAGPHKRKINVCVSMQGIKIKDEKTSAVIYHHPVPFISFISQDITDARAFGYVFGSTNGPLQFIAIKTEKPAFHVVVALRDLFQTVFNHKQEAIQTVKEHTSEVSKETEVNSSAKVEAMNEKLHAHTTDQPEADDKNIAFEVLLTEPIKIPEEEIVDITEPVKTVDELLDLQSELNKLQEGIHQMDNSIAAAAAFNSQLPKPENDPFDTSFVLGPKRDSFPLPMPTPIPVPAATIASEIPQVPDLSGMNDRYAVFNIMDSGPSIFEALETDGTEQIPDDLKELEEEIARKAAPAKPPRLSKSASPDLSVFADLDPLGKDRPYKDKAEFFQDVKNPPKKVLNDLLDPSKETIQVFDPNVLSSSVQFPVDFESMPPNSFVHSTPPTNYPNNLPPINRPKAYSLNENGERIHNRFDSQNTDSYVRISNGLEPGLPVGTPVPNGSMYIGKSPPANSFLSTTQQPLTVNCAVANLNSRFILQQNTSSPIPIPTNHTGMVKDRAFSNGSIGSPYSKSPLPYNAESPSNSDYYMQSYNSEGDSPTGIKNGLVSNGESEYISSNTNINLTKQNINSLLHSSNTTNGVSRPRPRPSLTKGVSIPNGGRTVSSHSLSSDSSSDYEAISRENMQSIANVLLTNGHRLRAQSLSLESNNEFQLKLSGEKNIFAKKNDPFADDFFFSIPKKNNHLSSAEIPEYV